MYTFIFNFLLRPLFVGTLIVACVTSFGQNSRKIDSLNLILQKQTGIVQFETLVELAISYVSQDIDQSIFFIDRALNIASQERDSVKIVRAGRIKGQLLWRMEKLDEAIELLERLLPTAKRNNYINDHKVILNTLALAYTLKADYNKALDYNFQSLVIRENEGDKAAISISLNNIGLVYFKLRNHEKAVEYYQRALQLKKEVKDTYDLDRLLVNLGLSYNQLKRFKEGKESIEEGFKICGDRCHDEIIIDGKFGLGVTYYGLEQFDEAKKHFQESLKISLSSGNKRFQAENSVYLARIAMLDQEFDKAESFLKDAEQIANTAGYNQLLIDTYKEFSNLFNRARDFEKASDYQNRYIALKDALIGEELVKNIARTQSQFEERHNIAIIAAKEEALARQRMLNIAIGLIAVLSALLVFVMYRSNKVQQRINRALSEAKAIIEEQNNQLQAHANNLQSEVDKATADLTVANASLKKVNEELDNFIYKTSHDIRGPLASLKGMCNVALMDVKDALALDYLSKLDVTATKLNRILTRLLIINQINHATIHPELLEIENLVDDIILLQRKRGVPANMVFEHDIQKNIPLRSDDALVRIILENLVDNAIKFYNDSPRVKPFVLIKISADDDNVELHVIDNGIGISEVDPDKIFQMFSRASERSGTGGLGLYLIKQAVNRLGGAVGLKVTPEGYTEFYVTLPLEISPSLLEKKEVKSE